MRCEKCLNAFTIAANIKWESLLTNRLIFLSNDHIYHQFQILQGAQEVLVHIFFIYNITSEASYVDFLMKILIRIFFKVPELLAHPVFLLQYVGLRCEI